jgi:hypothetical protein
MFRDVSATLGAPATPRRNISTWPASIESERLWT